MNLLKLVTFVVLVVSLVACGSSQAAIQTAIAQTQAAAITDTLIPPTLTPLPTETSTPSPTSSPTSSLTPTPTPDLRIIQADPKDLIMIKADLPTDGKYYLPNETWIGMLHNEQIVGGWTVDKGKAYLAATGRIDGMWIAFNRGSTTVIAPQEMYDNAVIYKTVQGAQLTLTKYDTEIENGYTEIVSPPKIGDLTRAFSRKEMQPSGDYRVWVGISFTYRNVYHNVKGWGWEKDVSLDYVEKVANAILLRMEEALPLTTP